MSAFNSLMMCYTSEIPPCFSTTGLLTTLKLGVRAMADESVDARIAIYKVTCTATGRGYIGITMFSPSDRWKQHVSDARRKKRNGALQRAILKYGPDGFELTVLASVLGRDAAAAAERHYIIEHRTRSPNGFNMSDGGEWEAGFKLSEDLCRQRSKGMIAARAEAMATDPVGETLRREAAAQRGIAWVQANRQQLGTIMKGWWAKRKTGGPVIASVETRQKMSESHKKRWSNPLAREKRCASMTKAMADPATREVLAERSRQAWADPDRKAARLKSAAAKRAANPPQKIEISVETRQKMSESAKRRDQRQGTVAGKALRDREVSHAAIP